MCESFFATRECERLDRRRFRSEGHNVAELDIKLYGSDQGHIPRSRVGIAKYVRNVRISGERIWR